MEEVHEYGGMDKRKGIKALNFRVGSQYIMHKTGRKKKPK